MNKFGFLQSNCMLQFMTLHSVITKSLFFLFISLLLCPEAFAAYYRVTAPNGLNVRASANKYSEVLGELSQGNVVGTLYHLTQDSQYSECDYTDQFGDK